MSDLKHNSYGDVIEVGRAARHQAYQWLARYRAGESMASIAADGAAKTVWTEDDVRELLRWAIKAAVVHKDDERLTGDLKAPRDEVTELDELTPPPGWRPDRDE